MRLARNPAVVDQNLINSPTYDLYSGMLEQLYESLKSYLIGAATSFWGSGKGDTNRIYHVRMPFKLAPMDLSIHTGCYFAKIMYAHYYSRPSLGRHEDFGSGPQTQRPRSLEYSKRRPVSFSRYTSNTT